MTSALTQDWGGAGEGLSELIDTFGGPDQNQVKDPDGEDAPELSASQEVARGRRMELDRRWSWYRATQYDHRCVHWDGGKVFTHADAIEASASSQVPAGFWVSGQFSEAGSEPYPLRLRRPCAPAHLGRSVIQRFSGLLFGAQAHPGVASPGHPDTEDWLAAFITETRLWAKMLSGRAYGGAMGSFAVGFKFVGGRPRIEIHDPRTALPVFRDRETMDVKIVDKRYTYDALRPNEEGVPTLTQCIYRRLITERVDIVWPCVITEPGLEPEWAHEEHTTFRHDWGFCPIVWVQNIENATDIDGDPDIHGIYDLLEQIDALRSQASVGAIANCDPTLVVSTDAELPPGLRKGSSNAIELPAGSTAEYLELQGTSIKVALDTAENFRDEALATARCVLKSGDSTEAPKTATEIEKLYGEMHEQVDVLREQYGEQCVRRLLEMVLKAARIAQTRGDQIKLRPNADGQPRKLGLGEYVELTWPPHVEPDMEEVSKAVGIAKEATQANLIPLEEGTRFIAPYMKIESAQDAARAAREEAMQHEDEAVQSVLDEQEVYPEESDEENFETTTYDKSVDDLTDEELGLDPMDDLSDPETADAEVANVDQVEGGTVAAPSLAKDPSAALNGAQVSSLLEIVTSVTGGTLPIKSAHAILMAAFPLTEAQASAILDPVEAMLAGPPMPTAPPPADVAPGGPPAVPASPEDDAAQPPPPGAV